jgi:hypothetical protein
MPPAVAVTRPGIQLVQRGESCLAPGSCSSTSVMPGPPCPPSSLWSRLSATPRLAAQSTEARCPPAIIAVGEDALWLGRGTSHLRYRQAGWRAGLRSVQFWRR